MKGYTKTVCQFCGQEVYHYKRDGRVYDLDMKTFHIKNCERRKEYFRRKANEYAEARRKRRPRRDDECLEEETDFAMRIARGFKMLDDDDQWEEDE